MKRVVLVAVALVASGLGCDPVPRPVACATYVAGGFNRENGFAFAVDSTGWPRLAGAGARIELTFLLAAGKSTTVDLVHVAGDRELERWSLPVRTENGKFPFCVLAPDAATSTCGATVNVLPHDVGGYWHLRGNDDLLEAGMSFVLCRPGVAAADAAAAPAAVAAPARR